MAAPPPDRSLSEPISFAPIPLREHTAALIPTPLTALVGREQEVAALTALLLRPEIRLLTLIGPGGVGKTRLVLELAGQLHDTYADGATFIALAAVPSADLVMSAIAQALNVRERGDESLSQTVVSALRTKQQLLVLDNLEHVLAATPLIADILTACPHVSVLATSRATLRISGEQDFPVPPLGIPAADTTLTVEELGAAPAVQLFVARAQSAQPDFALTAANATAVAAICRRLDGLPLAIELAAARTRHLPAPALLKHLDKPLPFLTGGPRNQPVRLQGMRDAIAWSYELLTGDEQAFFRRLAVLAGGGSLDAVAAVISGSGRLGGDVVDGVRALVEQSLLIQTEDPPGEPRYGMLETIREFGLEQLAASGEEPLTRSAHATYYLSLAEQAEPHLIVSGSAAWVERLAIERANLQTAVVWALQTGNANAVLRLAGTILSFAYAHGEPREGQQWLEAALAENGTTAPETRVDALFTASALAQVRGDFTRSTTLSEEGLVIAERHGYTFGRARALLSLGITAEWQGDLDLAAERYKASRDHMRTLKDTDRLSHWTLLPGANLADLALLRGDANQAAILAEEAVTGWRRVGYLWGIAQALGTAAAAASEQGDQALGARLYGETLALWLDSDDGRGIAGTLAGIAGIANHRGQSERAARLLGAAWGIARGLGVQYLAHHVHAERVFAATRSRLHAEVFDAAWEEGQGLSIDQAVAEASALLATPGSGPERATGSPPRALSPRELEVLRLLVGGRHDREIASALRISPRTVQSHVASLFTKFGVNSRVELTAAAVRRGLV